MPSTPPPVVPPKLAPPLPPPPPCSSIPSLHSTSIHLPSNQRALPPAPLSLSTSSHYPPSTPPRISTSKPSHSTSPSPSPSTSHIIPILSHPTPSPQRRKNSLSINHSTPPRRLPNSRSTSIDLQPSSSDYTQSDRDDRRDQLSSEEEEEEEPMLPFNYRQKRQRTSLDNSSTRKFTCPTRIPGFKLTIFFVVATGIGLYLSWRIVFGHSWAVEGDSVLEEGHETIIKSVLNRVVNESYVDMGRIRGDGKQEEERELGKDGDLIKMENGQEFIYRNSFGGTFIKSNSSSLAARAQSDTPSLAESWDFETQTISGVNLGGWLTVEPFITPSLFEPFLNSTSPSPAVDEWTLSENLIAKGGTAYLEEVLTNHYENFITEKDFAEIAGAGLNWIRVPVPYWAVSKWEREPFLEKKSWDYFLKALKWSRKYGLRINLDLHSVPGSQNGWNHSGRLGSINWLHSTMGLANAQRSLDYISTIAEFISRPQVSEVVKMFSLLNEPMMNVIGMDPMRSFYSKAYRTIREQTGYGTNAGPVIAIHDGFKGTRRWFDFPSSSSFQDFPIDKNSNTISDSYPVYEAERDRSGGMDRVAIDSHRYLAFSEPDLRSVREQVLKPCQKWAPEFNKTFNGFGIPVAGEFSLAVNDCGRFLNNVNQGTRLEGTFLNEVTGKPLFEAIAEEGSCRFWEDYETWDEDLKASLRDLAYAQMDTFQNWFYWTWKTSPSLADSTRFANPLWSYSLGLEQGWIPRNPRLSIDFCYTYAQENHLMSGMPRRRLRKSKEEMEGWKVGRYLSEDQRTIPSEQEVDQGEYPFPPEYFNLDLMSAPSSFDDSTPKLEVAKLPRYTQTASPVILPGPDSRSAISTSNRRLWHTPIEGCDYPDAWHSEQSVGWSETCLSGDHSE